MRIAVLSDIHGNVAALEAVLADIGRRGVDLTVNLGDILSGGLWPVETAAMLMPLDLPTLRGNHERQVLTLAPEQMGASDRRAHDTISEGQRAWLAGLPETLRPVEGMLMVHGTPGSDIEYGLETVTLNGVREATGAEVEARFGGADADLILCGHTHLPRIRRLEGGGLVVNPGSVGLPAYDDDRPYPHMMEAGSPHARYAIVEKTDEGWAAELIAVAYDWDRAARDAEANGRPDWARALATGRV